MEAFLNSHPLTPLPCDEDVQVLTPSHFLIVRPLEPLPDTPSSYLCITTHHRWELCRCLVKHFWQCWSTEYLTTLQKLQEWHSTLRNLKIGDIVVIRDTSLVLSHWPLAKVTKTYPEDDGIVVAQ